RGSTLRTESTAQRFEPGDSVLTRNFHPRGHTRLPRYARGKRGVITAVRGTYDLPDAISIGLPAEPQAVYSVRFDGSEVWGDSAEPKSSVYLDLWDCYLEEPL